MGWGESVILLFRVDGEQPSRYFEASGLGIALADQATLAVAFDLAELSTINSGVEGGARLFACTSARKRTQQGIEHERRQNCENAPEQHLGYLLCPGRLAIGERREGEQA